MISCSLEVICAVISWEDLEIICMKVSGIAAILLHLLLQMYKCMSPPKQNHSPMPIHTIPQLTGCNSFSWLESSFIASDKRRRQWFHICWSVCLVLCLCSSLSNIAEKRVKTFWCRQHYAWLECFTLLKLVVAEVGALKYFMFYTKSVLGRA